MNAKLDQRLASKFHIEHDCWVWNNCKQRYPYYAHAPGKTMYQLAKGTIPEGLVIDHVCRNTRCVNPDHLRAVTQRENVLAGNAPAALQHRRQLCIHGHPLSGENVYVGPSGRRQCKACRRLTDRKRRPRKCE